jgi:hypothetical protein
MKATDLPLCLLLNVGKPHLKITRVVSGRRTVPNHLRALRASSVIGVKNFCFVKLHAATCDRKMAASQLRPLRFPQACAT